MIKLGKSGQVIITVFVKPSSKETAIIKEKHQDAIFVRLKSPPTKGKANKELIRYFSQLLDIKSSQISIFQGHTSRTKKLSIEGISFQEAERRLY